MNIPQHVAFIPDGNGRWAEKHEKPRIYGHIKGAKKVEEIIEYCIELGIKHMTFYIFSTENWKRPKEEVSLLFKLVETHLKNNIDKFLENNIRIIFIGRRDRIPRSLVKTMEYIEQKTHTNTEYNVIIAIDYGGRDEIVRAVNKILSSNIKKVDEKLFRKFLDIPEEIPDPDLVIRTSGEMRISNFLLWYLSYSELYFSKKFWPEFDKNELLRAISSYSKRKRKFGGLI